MSIISEEIEDGISAQVRSQLSTIPLEIFCDTEIKSAIVLGCIT
ncbi:MAG: hypothetical protein AAFV71_28930 [Cyanobacteria bacterium J06633_8]